MRQEDLANLLGLKKSSIQKYESGKVQNLKLEKIQKLCEVFKITPFAFIYPENWEEVHLPNENTNEFYIKAKIFFELNEEGKQKVLEYIKDIGEIEKYRKETNKPIKMYPVNHNNK